MPNLHKAVAFISTLTILILMTGSASAAETFWMPKRADQNGNQRLFFINYTNGEEFCEEEGYNHAIGGTIYCGEDESGYNTFNWSAQVWQYQSTGSANGCWPLFASIICD